jgi:hypothetical protein
MFVFNFFLKLFKAIYVSIHFNLKFISLQSNFKTMLKLEIALTVLDILK